MTVVRERDFSENRFPFFRITQRTTQRPSMFRHHAPFGDDCLAHLASIFSAGYFFHSQRNFLSGKAFQLRNLRVAVRDNLKRLGAGFEPAKVAGGRQPVRLARELVGRRAFAFIAFAATQGIELSRQDVTGLDQAARLVIGCGRRRVLGRRSRYYHRGQDDCAQSELFAESSFRHFDRFRMFG
jgi:hypothetical protein